MRKDGWRKNKWKIVGGLVAVSLLAAGTGLTVARYRDKGFQPGKYVNERQKKDNQIVFPGQDIAMDDSGSDESEMWEHDENASDDTKPDDRSSAPMLFQTKKVADVDDSQDSTDGENDPKNDKDTVYSSKKDKKDTNDNGDKTITDNSGGDNSRIDDGTGNGDKPGTTDDKPGKDDGGTGDGDKTGDGNKPGSGDNSGNDNKPGKNDNKPGGSDNKPGKDDKPGTSDDNKDDDNKPGKVDDDPAKPDPGALDVDTTVPTLPMDDMIIDADRYPGDDKIDINEDEYKRYSLSIIGIQNDEDKANCLYTGEYLNDQRVLCSVLVYLCVDGVPKYRLTQLGDNFKIDTYPQQVTTDTVDVTFFYRPGADYDWISGTYTYPILYSGKLLLKGWDDQYVEQYMVPKTDTKISMFKYYSDMADNTTDQIDRLFLGWSETNDGQSVGPFYTFEGTGARVMYPVAADRNSQCSSVVWDKYAMEIDGLFNYTALQTLTQYSSDDNVLDIQEGIQAVDLPTDIDWDTWELVIPTYSTVKIPASMMHLGGTFGDVSQAGSYSFKVLDKYEVDENNQLYSSYEGMLLNKDRTVIYSIPSEMKIVDIPATVKAVNIPYENSITEIHINSSKPFAIDFSGVYGAKIYVPASSYIKYLSAWGKNPGGNDNQLLPDNGQEQELVEDDQAIYTADGETLVSVKSSVDGVFVVKSGVKKIAAGALENCGQIDIMILPESISTIESGSLSDNAPGKIVFLGETAPYVEKGAFGDTSILQVEKTAKASYDSTWSDDVCVRDNMCYREFTYVSDAENGFEYLDEEACDDDVDGAVLIKAASDITVFDADSVPGVSWKMIAPRAFVNCQSLYLVELPETVKTVGRNAFAGCMTLQGVVSYAADTMTVADGAFDDTWDLRFVAFNAVELECYSYYGSASIFAVNNGSGYAGADRFSPDYFIEDVNGGVLLYGTATDDEGNAADGSYLLGATLGVYGGIVLRSDIREIATNVFVNCTNGFTLTGMDNVTAIGGGAFQNSGLMGTVSIPGTCVYVGGYAFSGCDGITDVIIDGTSLDKRVYVNPLGSNVFSWCTGIESVTIKGTGYYDLCENAFAGCTSLSSVEISAEAGIVTVSYGAFGMTAISEITLPESLTGIGYGVFASCSNLNKVNLRSTDVPELLIYGPGIPFSFGDGIPESGWLTVPEGCEQMYIDVWKYYMYGWTPADSGNMTDEEILDGENMIRAYLGMDKVSDQSSVDTDKSGDGAATEKSDVTENGKVSTDVDITTPDDTEAVDGKDNAKSDTDAAVSGDSDKSDTDAVDSVGGDGSDTDAADREDSDKSDTDVADGVDSDKSGVDAARGTDEDDTGENVGNDDDSPADENACDIRRDDAAAGDGMNAAGSEAENENADEA